MHEQSVYASRESTAERKLVNSFVIAKDDGDEEEEISVVKVLFLCVCFVAGDTEGVKLIFV